MTYKEFKKWCYERTCDGFWGFSTATRCIDIINEINGFVLFRRESYWRKHYQQNVEKYIVNPTNEIIRELESEKI